MKKPKLLPINQFLKGDCLEVMKTLPDNSIDLIITSPPYNIGKMHSNDNQYGTYNGNDMEEKEYQSWQIKVLNESFRVLKEDGSMFYNHKIRIKDYTAIHPLEFILKSKFILKQEIVWDMGKSANCDKIRFFPFSERIYWLVKDKKVKLNNINLKCRNFDIRGTREAFRSRLQDLFIQWIDFQRESTEEMGLISILF